VTSCDQTSLPTLQRKLLHPSSGRMQHVPSKCCYDRPTRLHVVISPKRNLSLNITVVGSAIAQAVNRWNPIAAARVRVRVWSCEICGEQSGAGAGFLRALRFPLPIFIPPITFIYHLGLVQWNSSGRSTKWTQSHPTKNKKIVNM
jgi:hypothetical protein